MALRQIFQISDSSGNPTAGRVLIAPDAATMALMVAGLRKEIGKGKAAKVAREEDLVIPAPVEVIE